MIMCKECDGTGKTTEGGIRVPDEVKCVKCNGSGNDYGYDIMEDLQSTLVGVLPTLEDYPRGPDYKHHVLSNYVLSIQEIDNGTYDVMLKNAEKIRAEKKERWLSWWVFTLPDGNVYNTKYLHRNLIRDYIFEKFFTELEQLEWHLKHRDWTYEMSDDHRAWSAGHTHMMIINALEAKLIGDGKEKETKELWEKYTPKKKVIK